MARTKTWIALAGVVMTLLGGVAAVVATSSRGTRHLPQVATSESSATSVVAGSVAPAAPVTTVAVQASKPATTGATPAPIAGKAPSTTIAVPTVADIQKIVQDVTSQAQQAAAATPDKPMTKEQVEAQLRAELKQLGINY